MSGWVIAAIIFVALFVLCLLFIHGASSRKPDWYQQEQDDIQMRFVSRKKHNERE